MKKILCKVILTIIIVMTSVVTVSAQHFTLENLLGNEFLPRGIRPMVSSEDGMHY